MSHVIPVSYDVFNDAAAWLRDQLGGFNSQRWCIVWDRFQSYPKNLVPVWIRDDDVAAIFKLTFG